jgi:chlorobactene glucosyltransferase
MERTADFADGADEWNETTDYTDGTDEGTGGLKKHPCYPCHLSPCFRLDLPFGSVVQKESMVLLHLVLLIALLCCLGSVLVNLSCFRGLEPAEVPVEAPLVSVLVPARNEARCIEACVRSLLAQDWPNLEVIVLDDCSDDGTGEILRALADPRLRVIGGVPLPEGWVGKNWACHQLAQAARGEWLFFTDADTEHASGTATAAVAYAQKAGADLLSAWPRLVTVTLGEQLIIPVILFFGMIFYPHAFVTWLQRHPAIAARFPRKMLRSLGAANGQSLLFRRTAYDRVGGHAALRDHLVEDVAFGRAVAERMGEGMRLENCEALRFSTCRMYRSFAETWSGFTKNARAVFEGDGVAFLVAGFMQFWLFLFPFVALCLPHAPRGLVLAEIAVIYVIRFILAVRFRTSWLGALLHPFGLALMLAIGANSGIRSARGGVDWKGRRYTLPSH